MRLLICCWCWCLCSLQLHLVHWNAGRFHSFAEASEVKNGLVVLAVFIEVLLLLSLLLLLHLLLLLLLHSLLLLPLFLLLLILLLLVLLFLSFISLLLLPITTNFIESFAYSVFFLTESFHNMVCLHGLMGVSPPLFISGVHRLINGNHSIRQPFPWLSSQLIPLISHPSIHRLLFLFLYVLRLYMTWKAGTMPQVQMQRNCINLANFDVNNTFVPVHSLVLARSVAILSNVTSLYKVCFCKANWSRNVNFQGQEYGIKWERSHDR